MKNKSFLIALSVFAVLLGAYFLTREPQVSEGIKTLEWPELKAEQVQAVEVSGTHQARLERSPNGWLVAAPATPDVKHKADEGQVKALLEALASFKAPTLVSERSAKHAEYEVDAAKGTQVKVTTADGRALALVLGKAGRTGGVYVRKDGADSVFLSPSGLAWQVRKDVTAWRDKTLSTVPAAELAKVTVSWPDGHTYSLKAGADGAWALEGEAPKGFRFDPAAAQRLTSQLTSLRAQGFLANETPDLAKAIRFRLEKKDGAALTVSLAEKRSDGSWPVSIEGLTEVATLGSWVGEQLAKRLDDLRDTSLFSFDVTKATRLAFDAAGKRTVVEKKDATWTVVDPRQLPAGAQFDPQQVQSVLTRLRALKASKVAPDATAKAFAKPALQVTVTLEGGATQRLLLGADAGSDVYARGAVDELTWLLPGHEKAWLTRGLELFAPPPPPPVGQANGLDQLPPEIRRQLEAQLRANTH
ncbi:MAG: DUF4340 domain-containing protein [Myxococcota bacterium]